MTRKWTVFSAAFLVAAAVCAPSPAATIETTATGNWSDPGIWTIGGSPAGRIPDSTDDIYVKDGANVTYDLSGVQTFKDIYVQGASTLGWKLTTGVNDVREMHITGTLSMPGNVYDQSHLYIGGTFGGSSIEPGDSLKLIFDTDGATLSVSGQRARLIVEGYSPAVRNVEIAGLGAGVNGVIDSSGGRKGLTFDNVYAHNLSSVKLAADGDEGSTRQIQGSLIQTTGSGYALTPGVTELITGNVIQTAGHGVNGLGSGSTFSGNTLTRTGARGGNGIDFPSYPGSGQTVANNVISGFDRGISEMWRLYNITFQNNQIDDCNYGLRWTNNGGGSDVSFRSIGDKFGTVTPNATYDVYIANINNGNGAFHFDGTVLASDPDPLNELYFMFNNGRTTFVAFRDFDGAVGDYRVWSSTQGLNWSDMVFAPRTTDTLTLEAHSAYSSSTPTLLRLDGDVEIGDLYLDLGTTLLLNGWTLTVNSFEHPLDGTVDYGQGGEIVWKTVQAEIPEPASALLVLAGIGVLARRRRRA